MLMPDAQEEIMAARRLAAEHHDIGFRLAVDLCIQTLRNTAKAMKEASKDAYDDGNTVQQQVRKEASAAILRVASVLRSLEKIKPKPDTQASLDFEVFP
jgi:transcriptional regulator NrdR family protein